MTSTSTAPRPFFGGSSLDELKSTLDRWEDGYLRGEELLTFLERLAVTGSTTFGLLPDAYRVNADACLDTAAELGYVIESRRAQATEVVVAEDFVTTDTSFGYAAAWRTVRVRAGVYPLRFTTISGGPVPAGTRPYYAVADLDVETIAERHAGSVTTWTLTRYAYEALVGRPARLTEDRIPGAIFR